MLRRKLLTILGTLIVLVAVVAVAAVWQLQGVLARMDHVNGQALVLVDDVNALASRLTELEVELYEHELGRKHRLDDLIVNVEQLESQTRSLGDHFTASHHEGADIYRRIDAQLPAFVRQVGSLATTRDPGLARQHNREALRLSIALRNDILELSQLARIHAHAEQDALAARFRWLVLGLSLAFLLMINLSIVMLWRVATMITRPVDELVAAARHLSTEDFSHRVELHQNDEFDELGRAFNRLAEQLAANERRRLEMLQQVARTLNHELNNATAIIEMQLALLKQRSHDPESTHRCLRQIRDNLDRMTRTVQSLKNIRRVVLTDYGPGEMMLDLEQSTQDAADEPAVP